MHEYIKRTDAIAEINRGDLLVGNCAEWAREIIWRTPYADVAEVKHGSWHTTDITDEYDLHTRYAHFHAACKYHYEDNKSNGHKYCPECGTRMDGGNWYE